MHFLVYDSNKNPIGQYTSDDRGYVYIDDLPSSGRYYLRELENEKATPRRGKAFGSAARVVCRMT